jgi:Ca-activated chloride channel family protein
VFELAYPWALLALPLPLLAWWLLPPHRKQVSSIRVPFFDDIVTAAGVEAGEGSVVLKRRLVQTTSMALIWMLIVIGLAKPQQIGEPITRTDAARDVMIAIDLSGSMDYADFPDQSGKSSRRLTVVQRVVDQFIAGRDSDRVGLIVFGDRAYLQLPFTRDIVTARELVGLMEVGMAGPRTAIGDAIGLAINAFESSEVDDRLLILLTDGNDTASSMTPINAAEIAALNDVIIYTIGVGDPEATGEDRVDFSVLESISSRTRGEFFTAENEKALGEVYQRIDALAPGEVTTQSWRPRRSLVHWPAGAALILGALLSMLLLTATKRRRVAG